MSETGKVWFQIFPTEQPMQLMTATDDSPRMLRLASQFLLDAAQLMEAETVPGQLMPAAPAPTVDEAPRVVGMLPELAAGYGAPSASEAFAKVPVGTDYAPNEPKPADSVTVIPPPPSSPTVAVTAPAANTASTTTPPTLDREGLPHDPRIHSATPTMTTSGTWRRRRNLDNATLVAVEAELRARTVQITNVGLGTITAGGTTVPPGTSATVSLPVIPPPPAVVAAPNAPTPVIPPPPANALTLPVPANETSIDPFRQLMRRIDGQTGEGGRLSPELAKPIHAEFGATGWADYVGKCRDKIPALMLRLDTVLA